MAARELLKRGLRKSIGSGANTAVWRDSWLPVCPPRPPNCRGGGFQDPYLLVYHLIDHHRHEWRTEVLKQIFTDEDIRAILSIKPSRIPKEDSFIWAYTKSGSYSVKSRYDLATQLKDSDASVMVLEPSTNGIKHKTWSTRTSKKLKHFIWQSVTGCLAVRDRLVDRHCGTDQSCPRCRDEPGTLNHCLFECPTALQVWGLSDIPKIPGTFPCTSLYNNIDHLLGRAKELGVQEETLATVPWTLWFIWKARNGKVFKHEDINPLNTIQLAIAEAKAWEEAQMVDQPCEEERETKNMSTNEENETILPRCQVDASWGVDCEFSGGGFVIDREDGGRHYGALATFHAQSTLKAELMALIWAMKSALSLRFTEYVLNQIVCKL